MSEIINNPISRVESGPEWMAGEPEYTLDGNALLNRGEVPLLQINELPRKLTPDRCIILATNFEPAPSSRPYKNRGGASSTRSTPKIPANT